MQTVSFQQSNRASSNPLIFPCHQSEPATQDIDPRDICSAVRAWAAAEGRVAVALQIQEAAEELQLDGVDFSGQADVWNVKLFRWLDNKEDSASYRRNVEQLVAEMERELIVERTRAGLAAAREKGRVGGRRSKLTPEQWAQAGRLIVNGVDRKQVAIIYDVAVCTLYKKFPALKGISET